MKRSLLLFLLIVALPAIACRYSVRDTGFVELDGDPYRLVLQITASTPNSLREAFEQSAAAVFLDSNIRFSVTTDPAAGAARLTLHSPDNRTLSLGEIPGNRTRLQIVEALERVALSPARIQLHDDLLHSYAVLVLVEGTDSHSNLRVRAILDEAGKAVARLFPSMPKPIDVLPPRILTVPADAVANEAVLIWGLGMEPRSETEPRVAVVFGRGRRVGDPVDSALLSRTLIQDRLALIGQDCECELDRSFLQGPVIPARWDAARQRAAANSLGFDPENPLIRAEISRIVLKGPAKPSGKRSNTGTFDALALGYSEEPVDAAESKPAPEVAVSVPNPQRPSPAPPAEPPPKLKSGVLAVWVCFSGLSLVAAASGLWLLIRSRKDRP